MEVSGNGHRPILLVLEPETMVPLVPPAPPAPQPAWLLGTMGQALPHLRLRKALWVRSLLPRVEMKCLGPRVPQLAHQGCLPGSCTLLPTPASMGPTTSTHPWLSSRLLAGPTIDGPTFLLQGSAGSSISNHLGSLSRESHPRGLCHLSPAPEATWINKPKKWWV